MDGTELTLDLMQVLELLDNSESYPRIISMCTGLQGKLRRIQVSAGEMCTANCDATLEAQQFVEEQVSKRTALLKKYSISN